MKRRLPLSAALLLVCVSVLAAQQPNGEAPPLALNSYVGTHIISVPPVEGVPFSATVVVKSERPLADGSRETLGNLNEIGRDARGRTHGENRLPVPESFSGEPPLVEVVVYDPQTHLRTVYDVRTHTARQWKQSEPHGGPNAPAPQVTIEDLGYRNVEGMEARGTRRTFTIPADKSGTGAPLAVVDEYWYSEDLHLNVLMRHTDPRIGVKTFTVTRIRREEPPQSFFELEGYRMIDASTQADMPQ